MPGQTKRKGLHQAPETTDLTDRMVVVTDPARPADQDRDALISIGNFAARLGELNSTSASLVADRALLEDDLNTVIDLADFELTIAAAPGFTKSGTVLLTGSGSYVFDGAEPVTLDGSSMTFLHFSHTADKVTMLSTSIPRVSLDGVTVEVRPSSTPAASGVSLAAAVALAKTLTPHGLAISDTNHPTVLVWPGVYELTANLTLGSAAFTSLSGVTGNADDVLITNVQGVHVEVLVWTHSSKASVSNLRIRQNTTGLSAGVTRFCSYFNGGGTYSNLKLEVDNEANAGSSYPAATGLKGTFQDIQAANHFLWMTGGGASGLNVKNCTATNYSFFYSNSAGSLTNCHLSNCRTTGSTGNNFGYKVTSISGCTFENCVAAGPNNFAYDISALSSTRFLNCTSAGSNSFGYSAITVTACTFTGCHAAQYCFLSNCTTVANCFFSACKAGNNAFMYACTTVDFTDVVACVAGASSFASSAGTVGPYSNFKACVAAGSSFGSWVTANAGQYFNCKAGDASFSGSTALTGRFVLCEGGAISFTVASSGVVSGYFFGCKGGSNSFGSTSSSVVFSGTAIMCEAGAGSFGYSVVQAVIQGCKVRGPDGTEFGATGSIIDSLFADTAITWTDEVLSANLPAFDNSLFRNCDFPDMTDASWPANGSAYWNTVSDANTNPMTSCQFENCRFYLAADNAAAAFDAAADVHGCHILQPTGVRASTLRRQIHAMSGIVPSIWSGPTATGASSS